MYFPRNALFMQCWPLCLTSPSYYGYMHTYILRSFINTGAMVWRTRSHWRNPEWHGSVSMSCTKPQQTKKKNMANWIPHCWSFVRRIHWSPNSPHEGLVTQRWCFLGVSLNKQLNEQSNSRWFETIWCSLWRHCNGKVPYIRHSYSQIWKGNDGNCICLFNSIW